MCLAATADQAWLTPNCDKCAQIILPAQAHPRYPSRRLSTASEYWAAGRADDMIVANEAGALLGGGTGRSEIRLCGRLRECHGLLMTYRCAADFAGHP
jgi:hypothetical protein